ncbi:MAG: LysR family transcriptional regulator [Bacillota bacterium]|nr:LysR family transcriptional regulator [Bacillota bacterium]
MNTSYFKYAVEIEKAGSITQAAQNLYMAQPNLSKAIKDLEKELGYAIFKRGSGGVKVTDRGGEFLYHARRMLEQLEEMEKIGLREREGSGRFKISIPRGSYIANGFTEFVAELSMAEGMEITVNETNAARTIDNVVNQGYNMGIIRYRKDYQDYFEKYLTSNKLEYETIWEFEYVLVMSENHPLAHKKEISGQDLEEYVKITHGDIEMPQMPERRLDQEHSTLLPEKVIYVYERGSQFDLLTNVPTTYMWVSPLPKQHLKLHHLVQRRCKVPNNLYRDVLLYRKDYQLGENDILFQKKIYESKVEVASAGVI